MIEIIYSSKNFVVLKHCYMYYCYSYCKLIAWWNYQPAYNKKMDIQIDNSKIESQKNKCHLKQFKEIMKELEQNNTL